MVKHQKTSKHNENDCSSKIKKNSDNFPKKILIFCEMEPSKKSFLYFRRELSIFLEKTSILGNESFVFRKGLANPEKTKDYLHSLGFI